jgi:VanZ family protein
MNVNHLLKLTLSWLAVLLLMLAIFLFSAQPADISNSNSKAVATSVVETTVNLTETGIPEPEKRQLIERVNDVAREYMHGVLFLVLGLLVQNALTQSGARGIKAVAIALAISIIYGITDEIHQVFVPGRAFQISDLAMDAAGSIIGIAAGWLLYNRGRLRRRFM